MTTGPTGTDTLTSSTGRSCLRTNRSPRGAAGRSHLPARAANLRLLLPLLGQPLHRLRPGHARMPATTIRRPALRPPGSPRPPTPTTRSPARPGGPFPPAPAVPTATPRKAPALPVAAQMSSKTPKAARTVATRGSPIRRPVNATGHPRPPTRVMEAAATRTRAAATRGSPASQRRLRSSSYQAGPDHLGEADHSEESAGWNGTPC
jgi:hypothetical protein